MVAFLKIIIFGTKYQTHHRFTKISISTLNTQFNNIYVAKLTRTDNLYTKIHMINSLNA